jgi:hypothetical protein
METVWENHKIDELLQATELPMNIDAILDSTGDSKVPLTPHPSTLPYENADFMTILGSISIIT